MRRLRGIDERQTSGVELRQLHYFVEVAETLHFGRAAERLHIGQPAVSQQIRRLERELGVDLFDRSSRLVRLTPAGQRLLPEARAVLVATARARRAVEDDSSARPAAVLRLGTSSGLGDNLDRLLESFRDVAPAVRVELVSASTAARLDRVRSGQLDAAFVRGFAVEGDLPEGQGPTAGPGLRIVPVWRDELVAILPASHPLSGQDHVRVADLSHLALRIVPRRLNQPLFDLVVHACASAGFQPVLGAPFTTLQDTLADIAASDGSWTVMYASHASRLVASRLAVRSIRDPGLSMPAGLAIPDAPPTATIETLIDVCRRLPIDDHRS